MAGIALVVGLFLVLGSPGLFDSTMSQLIMKQSKQATNLTAGHLSRLYVGSFYSGFGPIYGRRIFWACVCSCLVDELGAGWNNRIRGLFSAEVFAS